VRPRRRDVAHALKEVDSAMFGLIGNVGPWELILILTIALIILGPGKLPEAGKAIGRAMSEFKRASSNIKSEIEEAVSVDEKDAGPVKRAEARKPEQD
jgi:sec-independent protein translocase protein TatA